MRRHPSRISNESILRAYGVEGAPTEDEERRALIGVIDQAGGFDPEVRRILKEDGLL